VPTLSPPHLITWPWAVQISATRILARTRFTGIPQTPQPLGRRPLTFRKSPGMTLALARCFPTIWASARRTVLRAYVTTRLMDLSCRRLLREEVAPARAPQEHPRSREWLAALVRVGRSLLGNRFLATRMTAFATLRTFRFSPLMVCGATITFSVGQILPAAEPRALAIPAAGLGPEERPSRRPSSRLYRPWSIRRRMRAKATPTPFTITSPTRSTAPVAARRAIPATATASLAPAFSMT
jgi:hypothetical protein